jgi:hypothetical protein
LPPGDLARVLGRALDALRQLGNLPFRPVRRHGDFDEASDKASRVLATPPGIHPEIRRLCREAANAINRYPVKDTLAFEGNNDDDNNTESDDENDDFAREAGKKEGAEEASGSAETAPAIDSP